MLSIRLIRVLGFAAAIALPMPASATVITAIDEFFITRSSITVGDLWLGEYEGEVVLYRDSFSDGAIPPSGGVFVTRINGTYSVLGGYAAGAEANGKLGLDSSLGGDYINAAGGGRTLQRSVLLTDFDTSNQQAGLKEDSHTFSVFGLFDLAIPPERRDGYGISIHDGGPSGATEAVDLFVRREENGSLVIRLQEQDFLNGVINTLQLDDLLIPTGADQIELQLRRADLQNGAITASYRYWTGGAAMGSFTSMAETADFFTTNGWARGAFFAVEGFRPAPEPSTSALLLLGMSCLLLAARQRRLAARR